ncbi:LysR family transcriptional regulator [Aquincola sp. MAHUQ-54]|uniref:LysR family transcriptional regulator n=1 Tax=Aquincola agrisoli TaxID=3119538 RepID=A0AAW9QCL5_9BURK
MPTPPADDGRPARLHFDLTTLQLFIATAELGGVTRAAERVHIAPAAASRRILELESQFGLPLFERRPHGMALTDAGRAMLAHARSITHTVVRMQDDAASYRGGAQGVVRVAAPKSAVIQFLPQDIERCAAECPGVRIDLQEMNSQIVQQALKRGVVDIGIYEAGLGAVDLPSRPYRGDRLVAVAARGHALAGRRSVTLDDILGCDLIGLGEGSAISLSLERLAEEAGRILRMRMRVGGFDSIAALVAQGLGIGVMPQAVARSVAGGTRFVRVPIEGDWVARQFLLCHRPQAALSRAAQAVVQVLAPTPTANAASPK